MEGIIAQKRREDYEEAISEETFTDKQVIECIKQWLSAGENECVQSQGRRFGYFAGVGWAARCLRWHVEQLEKSAKVNPS